MSTLLTAPLFSLRFMKSYFVHMRPYLLFVSGASGLVGIVFGTNHQINVFVLALLPCFLSYGFGQALTDVFQTDTDAISASYRPLIRGEIRKKEVLLVSILGLLFCGSLLTYLNFLNLFFAILSIFGLVTYTFFKKNYWFLGPFYNGWIVALLPVMGFLSAGGAVADLLNEKMICLYVFTLFSYGNFVLMGYLKDISADRATGYKTFPVMWGWNATVYVGDFFVILSILTMGKLINFHNLLSIIFAFIGSIIAILGQVHAHLTKNKTEKNSSFAIAATVRSFVLWHIAVLLSARTELFLFSVLFYLFFELTLYLRPNRLQI